MATEHNTLARLLPFYMSATTNDKLWQLVSGFTFSAVFNALYLGILAFGTAVGIGTGLRLAGVL